MSLYEMRQNYTRGVLLEKDADADPMVQFRRWLDEAMAGEVPKWVEANAMTLATSDGTGNVTSRVVLLKGLDDGKFWFYTNYRSTKGQQIQANARVSLCFHWQHLERQVRIEGTAEKASREQSAKYFRTRPRGSQLGALLSEQSAVIASRDVLEQQLTELDQRHANGDIPCPDFWGGYAVTPHRIEFWQGGASRLHDRLQYRRGEDRWVLERLSP